ncbi:hypothetical protein EMQ25_05635 [Arsenicitalea aurantiaca]|uniref:DNA primase/polymerase bifunctional N-terminal domain-containing protein n=1 Tax=Arsenicitalea aurantiaca TaxID=1783274 RepID=A0A433XEU9_9HYPH|nr:bifunctional DNA primase/polymerase [Arsenicitalea aurantiaca]RUT32629.1 hypothetical protein EMQ25_05635 [Arsenicitalea aurantiaca]
MRSGLFEHWQAEYAAHDIATFPVGDNKMPAVRGYLKVGPKTSSQLALRFGDASNIGLACKRNKITVLDIDTPDERVLADALVEHGSTPFVVRTGSGNFQAWYRHNGEGRKVRPNPRKPIDILGDGYVVAPPSLGSRGTPYRIIQGGLDDLDRLPTMQSANAAADPKPALREGDGRNPALFNRCLEFARFSPGIEALMEKAMAYNESHFLEPMPEAEVLKVVASAWEYEVTGQNWKGRGARVVIEHDTIDELAAEDPRAFALLSLLMRHHWGREFVLAKAYAAKLNWAPNTFKAARDVLVEKGMLVCVHSGGRGPKDPPIYALTKGVKK